MNSTLEFTHSNSYNRTAFQSVPEAQSGLQQAFQISWTISGLTESSEAGRFCRVRRDLTTYLRRILHTPRNRMSSFFRQWAKLTVVIAMFSASALPQGAAAQFRVVSIPDGIYQADVFNLYLTLDGADAAIGLYVELPDGWDILEAIHLSERGRASYIDFSPPSEDDPRALVISPTTFMPEDRLLLQVKSSQLIGNVHLTTTPIFVDGALVAPREDLKNRTELSVRSSPTRASNLVAKFVGDSQDTPRLTLNGEFPLNTSGPYTLAFWMRTSGLNQIVMSSWTGSQNDDYALELIVNEAGFLEFFRGEDGSHVSMRSALPIADGNWHFAAVTNEPESGWMHFSIDGSRVDSLYLSGVVASSPTAELRLGQRPDAEDNELPLAGYDGLLDEIRFVGEQLSVAQLLEAQEIQVKSEPNNEFSYGFDSEERMLLDGGVLLVPSELTFRTAPKELRIDAEPLGVRLTFKSEDHEVQEFIVQRSSDGVVYDEISRLSATSNGLATSYEYMDFSNPPGVVFYRVMPIYSDGAGKPSSPLKAGLGEDTMDRSATLDGNFPNPFNPTTTISFSVQETQYVRISVWDLSGQMIRSLIDGTHAPGEYDVSFSADALPSGTYFVRMESGSGIQTHQMMLMK